MKTSESIKNIAPAFHKFQQECETPKKTAENKHIGNKYAPLDAILEVVTPALTNNGLFHVQETYNGENNHLGVKTIVYHTSGEFMEFETLWLPIGTKLTAQAVGSAQSYARRYSLCAALGIMAESEDDDGAAASQNPQKQGYNPTAISDQQKKKLGFLIKEKAKLENVTDEVFFTDHLQKAMNTKSPTKNWSKAQASQAITLLENWGKNKDEQK